MHLLCTLYIFIKQIEMNDMSLLMQEKEIVSLQKSSNIFISTLEALMKF